MNNKEILITVLITILVLSFLYIINNEYKEYIQIKGDKLSSQLNSSFVNGTIFGVNSFVIYLDQNNVFPDLRFVNATTINYDLISKEKLCGR